jgi:heme/copper-type cytochrome/quinol oxidase subunit 2
MDFLRDLFFSGVRSGPSGYASAYFANTVWMLLFSLILIYVALLLALMAGMYDRPETLREKVDAETRVKLCGVWCVFAAMVLVAGTAGWMYFQALLPPQPGLGNYLKPLAAHATVLVVLFLVWLGLHVSLRQDSKAAQVYLA